MMAEGAEMEGGEESYMEPAASIDEALQVAKDLLSTTEDQAAQAEGGRAFENGFKKAGGVDMKGLMS
jgi:hypothetical protein